MSQKPEVKKGDVVEYEGEPCKVLRRRSVTGLAMFQTSDYELLLESLDGEEVGWVGENEVERIEEAGDHDGA